MKTLKLIVRLLILLPLFVFGSERVFTPDVDLNPNINPDILQNIYL